MHIPPILPAAIFLAYASLFVGRSLWLWRARGINPYVFQAADSLQRFVERGFRAVLALFVGYVTLLLAWPDAEGRLGLVPGLDRPEIEWAGVAVQLAGAIVAAAGQVAMRTSWRIGIPAGGPGELVTGGIFRISRNPTFLGMLAQMAGVLLWSPTALTAALLVLGWTVIQVQVRQEEAALSRSFPQAWPAYAGRVRRWV